MKERENGFLFLHRKSLQSKAFKDPLLWHLWCWCLMKASFQENWVTISTGRGEQAIKLSAGQLIFTSRSAAFELNTPASTLRRRLKRLEMAQQVVQQVFPHYVIITIVNWDTYQHPKKQKEDGVVQQVAQQVAQQWCSNGAANSEDTSKTDPLPVPNNANNKDNKNNNKYIEIPPDINLSRETFDAFLAMRKKMKKPLTPYAAKLLFTEMRKRVSEGYEAEEVTKAAILHNWLSVYPIGNKQPTSPAAASSGPEYRRLN